MVDGVGGAGGAPLAPHHRHREVISKEAAGEYALDVFPPRWHSLIEEALAYWRGVPYRHGFSRAQRARLTSEFVLEVAAAAQELPTPG